MKSKIDNLRKRVDHLDGGSGEDDGHLVITIDWGEDDIVTSTKEYLTKDEYLSKYGPPENDNPVRIIWRTETPNLEVKDE